VTERAKSQMHFENKNPYLTLPVSTHTQTAAVPATSCATSTGSLKSATPFTRLLDSRERLITKMTGAW